MFLTFQYLTSNFIVQITLIYGYSLQLPPRAHTPIIKCLIFMPHINLFEVNYSKVVYFLFPVEKKITKANMTRKNISL